MTSYSTLPNKQLSAPNGIAYAYRDAGEGEMPLVLLQHFRGNLDSWDPALIDALASARRVITFDNAGVGGSTGATPNTIEQMGHDAIAFIAALDLGQVDLLGVLYRQLRRAADRADQAGDRAAARSRVVSAAGRRWHARVGSGGHRRDRHS